MSAADAQKFLEVMQAFHQPPGNPIHPGPDHHNDDGPECRPLPIGREGLAEDQVGDVQQFCQPRKNDHQREAGGFIPKDGAGFSGLFFCLRFHNIKTTSDSC